MDTIIDLGSSKVKITTFDQKKKIISHLSEKIDDKENFEEIPSIIKKLIKNSEKEISNHIEDINLLFDDTNLFFMKIFPLFTGSNPAIHLRRELFPEPDNPVITINLFFGKSKLTFFKLCSLAPLTCKKLLGSKFFDISFDL